MMIKEKKRERLIHALKLFTWQWINFINNTVKGIIIIT